MDENQEFGPRTPWWLWVVILLCMVLGLSFPAMLTLIDSTNAVIKGLTWLYPAYVLLSGFLAWQCYGRRTLMSWIILVLLVLSHACMYYLTFHQIGY